jgi:hypothetical protein
MVWNCDWAWASATIPTGSVSDHARAFRPRAAQAAAAAVHRHTVGFQPPLVTVSPYMRRTAHVRCAVGVNPSRHGFIEAKDPFSSSSLASAHSSTRAPPVIVRCAVAKSTAAPLRSPRIIQVDPGDGPPSEVVLSQLVLSFTNVNPQNSWLKPSCSTP